MNFAPHKLYLKSSSVGRDERGKPVRTQDSWTYICDCRCDDNNTKEFKTEDGKIYIPSFHVVCGAKTSVKVGDEIQCLDKETGEIRGSGKVFNAKNLNYLNYSELWV